MNPYQEKAKEYIELTKNVDMTKTYQKCLPFFKGKKTLLDLGCGSGRDGMYFHKQGFTVTGVDLSSEIIKEIKSSVPFEVFTQDILAPTITSTFDIVWACASLLHIPRNQQKIAFQNIFNLLKPEGVIYCSYKVGLFERTVGDLIYQDYTLDKFTKLQNELNLFSILTSWENEDALDPVNRPNWLNVILQKRNI